MNSLIRDVQIIPLLIVQTIPLILLMDVQILQLKLNSDVPDRKEGLGGTVLQVVNSLIRDVQTSHLIRDVQIIPIILNRDVQIIPIILNRDARISR